MTTIGLTTSGLERLRLKALKRARWLAEDGMRDLLRDAGHEIVEQFKANIESYTPGDVQDLRPATKKAKKKQVGFIYPILKRTGSMMESMYPYVLRVRSGKWSIQIRIKGAVNRIKARVHSEGEAPQPKRNFQKLPRGFFNRLISAIRAGHKRS